MRSRHLSVPFCLLGSALAVSAACTDRTETTTTTTTSTPPLPARACEALTLGETYPDAPRYMPGSVVGLLVDVRDGGGAECAATVRLVVTRHGDVVHEATQSVAVRPGERARLEWRAPSEDLRGYLAEVSVDGAGASSTGIDVSTEPTRYPRYGYVSVFPPGEPAERSQEIIRVLAQQYHLNMFQLYDWFWRHEDFIPGPPGVAAPPEWTDLFGRVHSSQTLRNIVDAIHTQRGLAMGYVALYAAREGYEQLSNVSPAWGIFEDPQATRQVALAFGGERYLFLFDPSNTAWQERMVSEYVDAIRTFELDGVHIDQFGPRPTFYRADGSPVELRDTFEPFLEAIDAALTREVPGRDRCVFNLVDGSVDGYAVVPVATSPACDLLYSELWYLTDTYEQVRAYVEQLRAIGRGRAVVLAVYPQYGEDVGTVYEAESAALEGVTVASDHAGFTGPGFVANFAERGEAITWEVDLSEDAMVTFVFRYANATGARATRTLLLDGRPIGKVNFPARGSWTDWSSDAWLQQRVLAGSHQVRLVFGEDDTGAVNIDRMTLGEFDEQSVRLQNAVIFASGATPIQIGDDVQSLSHEYFPNRSKTLTPALQRALRRQYSFITAHEEILFAPDVVPIAERLDRLTVTSPGHRLVTEGAGGIWSVLRRAPAGDVIHLVNLVGVDNARWRDSAPEPVVQENITLRYRVDDPSRVSRVLAASPDAPTGAFTTLPFTRGDGWIEIVVPRLHYWDLILVRFA